MIGVRLIVLRIVNAGSIPAGELCSKQSLIRLLNYIERGSAIIGEGGDSEADRDVHDLIEITGRSRERMSFHGLPNRFGCFESLSRGANDIGHVFFAAVASGPVRASEDIANDMTDVANGVASYQMPAPIVHFLEEVDVHHQHADLIEFASLDYRGYLAVKLREQAASRAKPGQLIALCHLMKLLLKLGFEFVEHRKLHHVIADFYFVAVLQQLLRRNLCAVQKGAVC